MYLQIALEEVSTQFGIGQALSGHTGGRLFRVLSGGFLNRNFPPGSLLVAKSAATLQASDLFVCHTKAGPVLTDSGGCGLDSSARKPRRAAIEVVIFWYYRFDTERREATDKLSAPPRPGIDASGSRRILHVDLDAFFVAIERLGNPWLIGKPVIVGGSPQGRGVVASASYEARRFGVRSAMPVARARHLCPNLVVVPAHHDRYREASGDVMRILRRYSPAVEPVSIDEAYVDLTGTSRLHGAAADTCRRLREQIKAVLGLETSHGLAKNKLVAKIASDLAKPNGLIEVIAGREAEFLAPLAVSRLPGIGPVTSARLDEHDVHLIGDLVRLSDDQLEALFGYGGRFIRSRARGEGESRVEERPNTKSIGHEETFAEDTHDRAFLSKELYRLVEHAACRLRERSLLVRTVHLKLRYRDFTTVVRETTLDQATDLDHQIFAVAEKLLLNLLRSGALVRLIGVRLSNFVTASDQITLFGNPAGRSGGRAVIRAVDAIRARHGHDSIQRGRIARGGLKGPSIHAARGKKV